MIRQLILTDFLAHKHTVLDLGPGLTVLTGPNNSGKSAIVEALRCLVTNPTPRHVIRHGAKECSVEVVLDDGVRVVWRRKPRYALYEIHRPDSEPEIFAKMGRSSVPEPVAALLRLAPVELEAANASVDVHIGNQREPIFLLDKPGSVLASFFASSTEASHLVAMQQALKNRVVQASREEKELKARQRVLTGQLDSMRTLPDVRLQADAAAEISGRIALLARTIPGLERVLVEFASRARMRDAQVRKRTTLLSAAKPPELPAVDRLQQIVRAWRANERNHRVMSARYGALQALNRPADLLAVQELGSMIRSLYEQARQLRANSARQSVLVTLTTVPALKPVQGLAESIVHLQVNSRQQGACSARKGLLDTFREPPVLQPVAVVAECLKRFALLGRQQQMLGRRAFVFAKAEASPVLTGTANLAAVLTQLKAQQDALHKAQSALASCSKRLEAAREHIRAVLEQTGQCPTCGSALSIDTFLSGEHWHA